MLIDAKHTHFVEFRVYFFKCMGWGRGWGEREKDKYNI